MVSSQLPSEALCCVDFYLSSISWLLLFSILEFCFQLALLLLLSLRFVERLCRSLSDRDGVEALKGFEGEWRGKEGQS